jgi:glycosyltransferase involved in cell wall biosynthesis
MNNHEPGSSNFFSIVIPCHNAARFIGECLNCIFSSTFKQLEVICIDDGSTDKTSEIVSQYDNVQLINNKVNIGAAATRNIGIDRARGNIVLLIDSDVLVYKDTIEKINNRFLEGMCDAVVGVFSDNHPNSSIASNYKNLHLRYTYLLMPDTIAITNTSCVAIKKNVLIEVSGFDEDMIFSAEDWDLGHRIAEKGHKIFLDKSVEVIHMKKFTLGGILKTDAYRAVSNLKMVIRSRKRNISIIDSNRIGSIPSYIILSAPIVFSLTILTIMLFVTKYVYLIYAVIALLALYTYVNRKFFIYLSNVKGFRFALTSAVIYFIDIWCMIIGGLKGLTEYFIFREKY